MANRTDPTALSVHGTNPQYLIEKIVRLKIHACTYWKEHCYALTSETLVDKAVDLEYVAGTYGGNRKPAPFLCLILKMLQLQPELEIVFEFIKNKDYKYVTALGCFYLRLIGRGEDIYNYLEPLYNDYRKLRYRETDGNYKLIHMDEFVDELIHKEALCDTILPRIQKRQVLEDLGSLKPRHSVLEDLEEDDETLLAEIRQDGNEGQGGVATGADELVENPRAEALKPDRSSEEKSKNGDKAEDGEKEEDDERKRRKEKRKHKKEKKKTKYRTRGSVSRSRSRERDKSERSDESRSRSRSRSSSRSERKKKKSKWKKQLKEKRKDREKDRSKERDRDRYHKDEDRDKKHKEKPKDKDHKKHGEENDKPANLDENSDEYWLNLRAKLGLKPL